MDNVVLYTIVRKYNVYKYLQWRYSLKVTYYMQCTLHARRNSYYGVGFITISPILGIKLLIILIEKFQ